MNVIQSSITFINEWFYIYIYIYIWGGGGSKIIIIILKLLIQDINQQQNVSITT